MVKYTQYRDSNTPESYRAYREAWESDGWRELVLPLISFAEKHSIPILQIKEKFGGLRFYHGYTDDHDIMTKFEEMVTDAENASYKMCETCGAPGKRYGGSWITTRCDVHAPKDAPPEKDV